MVVMMGEWLGQNIFTEEENKEWEKGKNELYEVGVTSPIYTFRAFQGFRGREQVGQSRKAGGLRQKRKDFWGHNVPHRIGETSIFKGQGLSKSSFNRDFHHLSAVDVIPRKCNCA